MRGVLWTALLLAVVAGVAIWGYTANQPRTFMSVHSVSSTVATVTVSAFSDLQGRVVGAVVEIGKETAGGRVVVESRLDGSVIRILADGETVDLANTPLVIVANGQDRPYKGKLRGGLRKEDLSLMLPRMGVNPNVDFVLGLLDGDHKFSADPPPPPK